MLNLFLHQRMFMLMLLTIWLLLSILIHIRFITHGVTMHCCFFSSSSLELLFSLAVSLLLFASTVVSYFNSFVVHQLHVPPNLCVQLIHHIQSHNIDYTSRSRISHNYNTFASFIRFSFVFLFFFTHHVILLSYHVHRRLEGGRCHGRWP